MNRQTQVTDQTRTNLREAFWELYAEKSIEKITVREITDRAGYNRATFYLYYRDVYDVLEQVEDTVVGGIESLVNDRLMRGESLDFTEHMGTILQLSRKYSSYIAVLLGDNGDPAFASKRRSSPSSDASYCPSRVSPAVRDTSSRSSTSRGSSRRYARGSPMTTRSPSTSSSVSS